MDSACGDAPQRSPRKFSAPSAFQALSSPHRRRPREKRQHGKSLGSLLGVLVLSLCASRPVRSQTSILGFTPSSATRENQIETKFKAIPSPDEERRQHHLFTASRTSPVLRATTNWPATSPISGARKVSMMSSSVATTFTAAIQNSLRSKWSHLFTIAHCCGNCPSPATRT